MSAPDELAEMKRYDIFEHSYDVQFLRECPDGDYVKFADADRVIAARDARIAEQNKILEIRRGEISEERQDVDRLARDKSALKKALASRDAEIAEARRQRDDYKQVATLAAMDAARYQHIQMHGFPVRNQTGDPDRRWIAFFNDKEFFGATPSFAIDAARTALTPPSQAPEARRDVGGESTGEL